MREDKYQIKTKAKYLKLLLLKDDLTFFHTLLQSNVKDGEGWRANLRYTRYIFVILNTVLEAANQIKIKGTGEYAAETRQLRKTLTFINHFRNIKGVRAKGNTGCTKCRQQRGCKVSRRMSQ